MIIWSLFLYLYNYKPLTGVGNNIDYLKEQSRDFWFLCFFFTWLPLLYFALYKRIRAARKKIKLAMPVDDIILFLVALKTQLIES